MINENKLVSPLTAPSKATLDKFESFCRVQLPDSYKIFLSKYNGAKSDSLVIVVEGRERLIERFLCITDEQNTYSIGVILAQIEDRLTDNEDLIGSEIIPFASLFGGDFLCLDFRQRDVATVILWDHNESDELDPVTYEVCKSFEDFQNIVEHK